jgi:cobalt-precorrin-5B (C1)-methyltransferase
MENPETTGRQPEPLLRTGFTTGACAAAAARAATRALLTGRPVGEVAVDLPGLPGVVFATKCLELAPERATCSTIKDAGDDPDVTHGAEIWATAVWSREQGVRLFGGPGVGVVTRPGLPVPPGEPAINPGPRRMITRAVLAEAAGHLDGDRGLAITISVPAGEALAAQTFTPRLGIVGGISILGTTGIVRPYSVSAYRASIYVELKVASASGSPRAVLTTGRRSEAYVRALNPGWPEWSIVDVGDHMDYALKQVRRLAFEEAVISGMIGKISKLAQGRTYIHVDDGMVNMDFLADVTREIGADAGLADRVRRANTAHHAQVLLRGAGQAGLERRLAELAAGQVSAFLGGRAAVQVLLFHLHGELLAKARMPRPA